jgi:succinoglycan biosynthesis protein ExoM
MKPHKDHINVCICSYKRPELLQRLLGRLQDQASENKFTYSIVVVDNDLRMSAKQIVRDISNKSAISIEYFVEPEKGYSTARNKLVENAKGDYIAFIDDDEFPGDTWLLHLYETCIECKAAGVLGPVKAHFEKDPPIWLVKSKLCDKPGYKLKTGSILDSSNTRTSNVLIASYLFGDKDNRFNQEFGETGGEDVDFFKRMIKKGFTFVWCADAPVYETVPEERWKKAYFLRRALLQGGVDTRYGVSAKHKVHIFIKTVTASILYTISLPFLRVAGEHIFMKYLVKDCHHIGRLFAMCGIMLVTERNF